MATMGRPKGSQSSHEGDLSKISSDSDEQRLVKLKWAMEMDSTMQRPYLQLNGISWEEFEEFCEEHGETAFDDLDNLISLSFDRRLAISLLELPGFPNTYSDVLSAYGYEKIIDLEGISDESFLARNGIGIKLINDLGTSLEKIGIIRSRLNGTFTVIPKDK